jgi:hypothetical protein
LRWREYTSFVFFTMLMGCNWDPSHPFDREAPQVNQAIAELDAGDASAAAGTLEKYLATGPCEDGNIGAKNDYLRTRPDGTFDLGLSLFKIGESFGRRFGGGSAIVDDIERNYRNVRPDLLLGLADHGEGRGGAAIVGESGRDLDKRNRDQGGEGFEHGVDSWGDRVWPPSWPGRGWVSIAHMAPPGLNRDRMAVIKFIVPMRIIKHLWQ